MATIVEIKAVGLTAYGVKFIVCSNEEVIVSRTIGFEEPSEVGNTTTAAAGVIRNAGYDYDTESSFGAYNGGPRTRLVEPVYYIAEIGDQGDTLQWQFTWQRGAGKTEIPDEITRVAEAIADQAEAAMAAEVVAA